MVGWIKLYRQLQEHWLWQEKPFDRARAWIDLLLLVNHDDNKALIDGQLIDVPKGSHVTSVRKLADKWGWSRHKVSDFLDILERDKMITKKSDTKKTLITVENYGFYQSQADTKGTPKSHRGDTEGTQRDTNKNDKNDKNEKKILYSAYVKLTPSEYKALEEKLGDLGVRKCIEILDNYKGSSGKKYQSDYRAILSWVIKRYEEDLAKSGSSGTRVILE